MQALLKESVKSYRALPHELNPRRIRPRTNSRPSPYPRAARHMKPTNSPEESSLSSFGSLALQEVSTNLLKSPAPTLDILKPFSPLILGSGKTNSPFSAPPKDVRQRVGSAARRSALGWSKRSTKSSNGQKENKENASIGALMTYAISPSPVLRLISYCSQTWRISATKQAHAGWPTSFIKAGLATVRQTNTPQYAVPLCFHVHASPYHCSKLKPTTYTPGPFGLAHSVTFFHEVSLPSRIL